MDDYSTKAKISLVGYAIDRQSRGLRVWQHGAWKAEWWGHDGRAIVSASATSKEAALGALLRGLAAVVEEVAA